MNKSVKATHTETYVFDNNRAGRRAAEQMGKALKEKNGGDIYMSTSKAFGIISVTSRGKTTVEVDV